MSSAVTLSALASLVSQAASSVDYVLASNGTVFPDHLQPYDPQSKAEQILDADPEVQKALLTIASASFELLIRARRPVSSILFGTSGHIQVAALRTVVDLNIAEILREAGSEGLTSAEIAIQTGADANKISRILRYLSSQGFFVERFPGEIFANSRLSSLLDSGIPVKDLIANPDLKIEVPSASIAALVGHLSDEGAKAGAYLTETLLDPKIGPSGKANEAAIITAFTASRFNSGLQENTSNDTDHKQDAWALFDAPEQRKRQKRFNLSMEGAKRSEPPEIILNGFGWSSLPETAKVVDVGGGTGSASLVLARAFPQLRITIQDRPNVVEDGLKRWKAEFPEAIESGRVNFQVQDFFEAQPPPSPNETGPIVYMLKAILHDWSNEYAAKILKRLRDAADKDSKLIVIDRIVPLACRGVSVGDDVPGVVKDQLPEPLPANLGGAYPTPYLIDLNMLIFLNGQERTLAQTQELYRAQGWKIERVYQREGWGQFSSQILAVPI